MIGRVADLPRGAEIQEALSLIETRSGALGRFLRSYAQLARLPKPQLRQVRLLALARRVAELEDRLAVPCGRRRTCGSRPTPISSNSC